MRAAVRRDPPVVGAQREDGGGGGRRWAALRAFWVALAKLACRSSSLAGGVEECLPTAQPGSSSSSSKEVNFLSSQQPHHLRKSWKTGGIVWWRQLVSSLHA